MKSTKTSEPAGRGLMLIWVGVAVMTAAAIALFRLDGNIPRVIVGIALGVCVGMVAVMLWLDRRAERQTRRLAGRR